MAISSSRVTTSIAIVSIGLLAQGLFAASVGASGGLMSPSPRTLRAGSVYLGAGTGGGGQVSTQASYALTDALQLGVLTPMGSPLVTDMRLQGQLRLSLETPWTPEVALGFRHDGWYVAGAKKLGRTGFDVYGGVGSAALARGFAGISREFELESGLPMDTRITLSAERVGYETNVGAGLRLGQALWVGAFLQGMRRPVLAVQLSFMPQPSAS